MSAALIFGLLFALMLTGMPISISLGLTVLTFLFTMTEVPIESVGLKLFSGLDNFGIMAIPFFILAGTFLTRGGVARRMIAFTTSLVGHLPGGLGRIGDLAKGLSWSLALRRAGFPIVRHVTEMRAEGDGRLQRLRYRTADGREGETAAEVLLVHEGVVPNIHAPLAFGCAVRWDAGQHCQVPVLDAWGETSQANIFVAGDGAGIGGAEAAEPRGRLAALRVAMRLGKLGEAGAATAARTEQVTLARALALRPFLDALYAPRREVFAPADETLVCRCEEVTAGELRKRAVQGQPGPNQLKAFTRAGMGPCQGRQCGYTMAHIVAAAQNRPVADVGFYRIRPPLKPVTLGELASLDERKPAA